ncbi:MULTISPECIES: 2Fe-2S iron-sulfur cluster-binding protein [Rufibacter]|uniref:2Fe-2S ferredoxin n=1 Tax=Rufibacter quisquiliarum TaxID=1549639 RepID=A0A839GUM9_9BACT|nr:MULTISPECIES: 2Fe-2S iron-sulfur cluster-binding protein [Rufibacter]MBA9078128.1 2Fe-2S ferredoxin [Rufibacter quisquiliarum]
MGEITVRNLADLRVSVYEGQTVLAALQAQGIDWMHACGARGRCTSCRMIVLQGMENTAPPTPAEERFRSNGRLKPNERLTCQTQLTGPVTCQVPEQTKLPHMTYSG